MIDATPAIITSYVDLRATEMINWAQQHFGFHAAWKPKVRVSFDKRRKYSYGGLYFVDNKWVPGINLAMSLHELHAEVMHYIEYEHYATDCQIGSLFFITWKQYLDAMLCHELAHAVQHSVILRLNFTKAKSCLNDFRGDWQDDSHGELFQFILREFRMQWLPELASEVNYWDKLLTVD
jgi:hypothetical protein